MGYHLLERHPTNPAGHYEDKEFLALHNDILKAHNADHKVTSKVTWHIDPVFQERAKTLIINREAYPLWGWKDPRTCLFLDLWKSLLPECLYLVCYRHYLPVILSMITRDMTFYEEDTSRLRRILRPRYTQEYINAQANTYLKVWIHYNSEILAQIESADFNFLLTSFDNLVKDPLVLIQRLAGQGFKINPSEHLNPGSSRSREHRRLQISPDPGVIEIADALHERFQKHLDK